MHALSRLAAFAAAVVMLGVLQPGRARGAESAERYLRITVTDPLANRFACGGVAGYARRDYQQLADHLQQSLGLAVEVSYAESLGPPSSRASERIDLIAGKFSAVRIEAARVGLAVRPLAMLTDRDGEITQTGLFLVRAGDAAQSIEHLAGRRLLFGPVEAVERRSAAVAALEAFAVPVPEPMITAADRAAAVAVVENDADAAVISSYALPLLEGRGTIRPGQLEQIGHTDPVPLIGLFLTGRVGSATEKQIAAALKAANRKQALLAALESRDGFTLLPPSDRFSPWADWRGPGREATSPYVPATLPDTPKLLWGRTLTGPAMAGLAVADGSVVVADKDLDQTQDVFRCLDADTGQPRWHLAYPAADEMDFTNSPRANPVIHQGRVYLLGAFGDLHCVRLADGRLLWSRNLAEDFGARHPTWGYCSTPLGVYCFLLN